MNQENNGKILQREKSGKRFELSYRDGMNLLRKALFSKDEKVAVESAGILIEFLQDFGRVKPETATESLRGSGILM